MSWSYKYKGKPDVHVYSKQRLPFFSVEFVCIYLNISANFRNIIIIGNTLFTSKLKFS
jgi:hypothetical protein